MKKVLALSPALLVFALASFAADAPRTLERLCDVDGQAARDHRDVLAGHLLPQRRQRFRGLGGGPVRTHRNSQPSIHEGAA